MNEDGSFVIGLLMGNKEYGYIFAASHAHPNVFLGTIHIQKRVVENDSHWTEIPHEMFNIASSLHATGHVVKMPAGWRAFVEEHKNDPDPWDRLAASKLFSKTPATIAKYRDF
jgi:hypothetical protein